MSGTYVVVACNSYYDKNGELRGRVVVSDGKDVMNISINPNSGLDPTGFRPFHSYSFGLSLRSYNGSSWLECNDAQSDNDEFLKNFK